MIYKTKNGYRYVHKSNIFDKCTNWTPIDIDVNKVLYSTDQVKEYYICSVYMGNACIRAYGHSLIKVIIAGT
jgi:hypothetical protein